MSMKAEPEEWLILGITPEGRPFRPGDWPERLCGVLAHYDNNGRWVYSNHAQPVVRQGQMGVLVETQLKDINPDAYRFIMGFARDNHLKVMPGREVTYLDEPFTVNEVTLSVRKLTLALLLHQWKIRFLSNYF